MAEASCSDGPVPQRTAATPVADREKLRVRRVIGWLGLALLLVVLRPAFPAAGPATPTGKAIRVLSDGTIVVPPLTAPILPALPAWAATEVLYRFGMPTNPPIQRWLEEDAPPVTHAEWKHGGILYRQSVLVSRLGPGDPWPDRRWAPDAVILVKLAGESEAPYYTNAQAAFAVEREGQPLRLEFTNGVALTIVSGARTPVAWVDIPAGGVVATSSRGLTFEGSLPPGISGAMTLKIPAMPPRTLEETNRLWDLDFDEELGRLKKAWKALPPAQRPLLLVD